MKAEESKLTMIFADTKTYEIPKYQRPYSWTDHHTNQLLEDTWDAFESQEQEYFIGAIIAIEKERDRKFDIVDGQQRLTTLNLLFSKLKDLISSPEAKATIQARILPTNHLTGSIETPRLLIREQDQAYFKKHILMGEEDKDISELSETQLRLKNNFKVISDFLINKSQEELMLYANFLLENVYVVFVRTENLQSSHRLFNVLNARGLSLNNGDLIKNKLFELTSGDSEVESLVEEKWSELEDIITISKLDIFLGHHRTSVKGEKQRNSLHLEYEALIGTDADKPVNFIESLAKSAKNYRKILDNKFDNPKVKRIITSLNNVSHDEWIPPLLCYMNNPVEDLNLDEFILLLDKITFQNWVRRMGKTQRSTVYYQIITLLNRRSSRKPIIEKIAESANNEDFKRYLDDNIYGSPFAYAILHRLEEEMQDLSVTKTYHGTISIEHVLPQKLTDPYWNSRFSDIEHKGLVHKLGNLTLLSGKKNSSAQNLGFDRKKERYNRESKVSFDLTKEICELSEWTKNNIDNRQTHLINKALEIWSFDS